MSDDYCSAACKHLDDARFLLNKGRFDNAGYLSGYVVECALKVLVQYSGGRPRRYHHDLSRLTGQALRLACYLNPSLRRYSLPPTQAVKALTDGWNPSLRYQGVGTIRSSTARLWWKGAYQAYRSIVVRLVLDRGQATP